MMESQPAKNGCAIYGITLPDDFNEIVLRMADEANCIPHAIILRLAIQGERCGRLGHDRKLAP